MAELWIPSTIPGYIELRKWLNALKDRGQMSEWADAMRWYAQHDLFFLLNDILTNGRTENTETGLPLFFHQFYVDWCRDIEWQQENGGGHDASARRSGKSTLRTHAGTIQRIIRYPQSAGCLFSFERKAARKHFRGIKQELEQNALLKTLFEDCLFEDPLTAARNGETIWNMDDGILIKRPGIRKELTLEYNAFADGTPVGGGYDRIDFDDVEEHRWLTNEDMLDKLHAGYDAAQMLLTPSVYVRPVSMFTNTFYSKLGLSYRVYERYKHVDARKVRVYPAEDLTRPGDGPLGGTANYPFSTERLHRHYEETRDKREYAIQYCCDFLAGEERTLKNGWLKRYPEAPELVGRGRNIYICIDPSRGLKDPMAIWVWGLGPDRKAAWLDASVKKLDPALPEFYEEVLMMVAKWQNIGRRVVQIRVENFGQATYAQQISRELGRRGYYIEVIPCADNRKSGKFDSGKRDREFDRWAFPASEGQILIPKPVSEGGGGLVRKDERGVQQDLVDYFLEAEWGQFPKPVTDNMLDAGSLLWEPEDKMGAPLQYPRPSLLNRARQRFANGETTSFMSAG